MPLPGEEMKSPHLVFERLFSCYHFHEINSYLDDIKQWLINKNYPHQKGSMEHDNMLFFFEKLMSLIEAVHIIEKQRQELEQEIEWEVKKSSPDLFHMLFDKVDALYDASLYLHRKKQNALCCYLLHKTILCAYNALVITTTRCTEATSNLEELAKNCSRIFKGLPNPFAAQDSKKKYLTTLNTVTLYKTLDTDFTIEDEMTQHLLNEVAIIRRDICEYYETKTDGAANNG